MPRAKQNAKKRPVHRFPQAKREAKKKRLVHEEETGPLFAKKNTKRFLTFDQKYAQTSTFWQNSFLFFFRNIWVKRRILSISASLCDVCIAFKSKNRSGPIRGRKNHPWFLNVELHWEKILRVQGTREENFSSNFLASNSHFRMHFSEGVWSKIGQT